MAFKARTQSRPEKVAWIAPGELASNKSRHMLDSYRHTVLRLELK